MNYIEQVRGLWIAHESFQLTTNAIALYFYLLETNNKCGWSETFKRNNAKVSADLGMSFKTLQSARDRLVNAKLIEVYSKKGDANTGYKIMKLGKISQSQGAGTGEGEGVGQGRGSGRGAGAHNINQTKPNENTLFPDDKSSGSPEIEGTPFSKNGAEGEERKKGSAQKKKEDRRDDYYQQAVAKWFKFYQHFNKGRKPAHGSSEGADLQRIMFKLRQTANESDYEWTEDNALQALSTFLTASRSDEWLCQNCLLHNLNRQYNKILAYATESIQPRQQSTGKTTTLNSNIKQDIADRLAGLAAKGNNNSA